MNERRVTEKSGICTIPMVRGVEPTRSRGEVTMKSGVRVTKSREDDNIGKRELERKRKYKKIEEETEELDIPIETNNKQKRRKLVAELKLGGLGGRDIYHLAVGTSHDQGNMGQVDLGSSNPGEPGKRTPGQSSTNGLTGTTENSGVNWLERWRKGKETDTREKGKTDITKTGGGHPPQLKVTKENKKEEKEKLRTTKVGEVEKTKKQKEDTERNERQKVKQKNLVEEWLSRNKKSDNPGNSENRENKNRETEDCDKIETEREDIKFEKTENKQKNKIEKLASKFGTTKREVKETE